MTKGNAVQFQLRVGQRGRAVHLLNVGAKKRKQPEKRSAPNKLHVQMQDVPSQFQPDLRLSPAPKRLKGNDNGMQQPNETITLRNNSKGSVSTQPAASSFIQPQFPSSVNQQRQ